jgi:hypothetical protein
MIANIALDDALILPHRANPGRIEFSGPTGSRSRKRSVLAGTFSRDAEASDVFCRTTIIATAASAARIARTSGAILT